MELTLTKIPSNPDELVKAFLTEIRTDYVVNNPFFKSLKDKKYTVKQLQMAFAAFAHYRSLFSRFLGHMILRLPIETEEWGPCGLNLAEEYGYGKPGKSHGILYANFLRGIGLTVKPEFIIAEELKEMPECAKNFERAFVKFLASAPIPGIVGMSGAYELLDGPEAKAQREALQKYGFTKELAYFTEHEIEKAHFTKYNEDQLNKYWSNPKARKDVVEGFNQVYRIQDRFYSELHEFAISF